MTGPSGSNLNPDQADPSVSRGDVRADTIANVASVMDQTDPFAHLHKMSTTAGVGSGDYVAINGTAIACILLGLGSGFVLFDSLIFLVIPIIGLIAGIVGWQQISRSNGTQTGREIVVIGLLLSLGFGGYYSVKKIYGTFQNKSDEDQIVAQIHKLGELVRDGQYTDAYALFDDDFRKKFSRQVFETNWKRFSASPYLGNVRSIDWNKLLTFETNPVDESQQATGMILLYAKPAEPIRIHMSFRKVDGTWQIEQLQELFTPDTTNAAANPTPGLIGPPKPK